MLSENFTSSKDYETKEISSKTRMLVVSDADIIKNRVDSIYNPELKKYEKAFLRLDRDRYKVLGKDGLPKFVYGNLQFIQNAVDYLLGDESLIQLRQRTIAIRKLNMQRVTSEKGFWQMTNIVFPILVVILFGIVQHYLRKRKYASKG
jgi:ABC-type uncharacterized transport system involved in gliding motility auxiliary subunit